MRILVADKLASFVNGRLEGPDREVFFDPKLTGPDLTRKIAEVTPDVLVVRSTKVTRADFEASEKLALVVRAGAGVNTIDGAAASERGIYVANCPGKNAVAVAELAMLHLLNLDRRIVDNVVALRAGEWNKKELGVARGLRGRTLAVIGAGSIGLEVIRRAQAFGMRIHVWSWGFTERDAAELNVTLFGSKEDAVRDADAVTVHLALVPATERCLGESFFEAMKKGASFINTSRGEVVDHQALAKAIESRGLRVGLDVFEREPSAAQAKFDDPLAKHPNVYGTHHIGASTDEAEEAVGEEVIRIIDAFSLGKPIPNCVNLARRTPATHVIVVRHADRIGVLANVFGALREAEINVQDMQNVVFEGAHAACARIAVDRHPDDATLARIRGSAHVYAVSVASA